MYIVVSPQDPRSYAEFDCVLDAGTYYEVARDSLPAYAVMQILLIGKSCGCSLNHCVCETRKFPERLVN